MRDMSEAYEIKRHRGRDAELPQELTVSCQKIVHPTMATGKYIFDIDPIGSLRSYLRFRSQIGIGVDDWHEGRIWLTDADLEDWE